MTTFAVMLRSRPSVAGILMLIDDRRDAGEIAFELRRKGLQIDVREVASPQGVTATTPGPETLEAETADAIAVVVEPRPATVDDLGDRRAT